MGPAHDMHRTEIRAACRSGPAGFAGMRLMRADGVWETGVRSNVFILGLHRSGTTLLYQMLAAAGCHDVVTARHVVCFGRLRNGSSSRERTRSLLREKLDRLGVSSRGVDGVDLSPDTLEEYSFILDNLHAGLSITRRHFHVFRSVIEAIRRDTGEDRPLLLKNPWDFGNGRLIKSLMPDARIVYIHRNPFHTLSSLHRAVIAATAQSHSYLALLSNRYRTLTDSGFPWRLLRRLNVAETGLLARSLVLYAAWLARGYLKSARLDSHNDRIDVRYEDLCRRPNDTMRGILAQLRVDGDHVDYGAMIGAHTSRVTPQVARQRDFLVERLRGYGARVGYDLPRLAADLQVS